MEAYPPGCGHRPPPHPPPPSRDNPLVARLRFGRTGNGLSVCLSNASVPSKARRGGAPSPPPPPIHAEAAPGGAGGHANCWTGRRWTDGRTVDASGMCVWGGEGTRGLRGDGREGGAKGRHRGGKGGDRRVSPPPSPRRHAPPNTSAGLNGIRGFCSAFRRNFQLKSFHLKLSRKFQ